MYAQVDAGNAGVGEGVQTARLVNFANVVAEEACWSVICGGMQNARPMCTCKGPRRCSGALQPLQDRARAHCDVELFRGAVATTH